jgi:hypothetical protein
MFKKGDLVSVSISTPYLAHVVSSGKDRSRIKCDCHGHTHSRSNKELRLVEKGKRIVSDIDPYGEEIWEE